MRNIHQLQPASPLYIFGRGWRIVRFALARLRECSIEVAEWWIDKVEFIILSASGRNWFVKCCIYFWVCFIGLIAIIQFLAMVLTAGFFLGIFALFLALWLGGCIFLIGFLVMFVKLKAKYNAIFFCCPNCHKSMVVPIYLCPACDTEHTQLQPSRYGIFWRRCKGYGGRCNAKIPTLDSLGRRDLKSRCANPRCGRPLNKGIGKGSNIHIPIVGGTSVGKTSYMVMALNSFIQTYTTRYNYTFFFPDSLHEETFEENVQRLAVGRELSITTDLIPQAYNLIFKAPTTLVPPKGFVSKLLYTYDAAGEIFESDGQMDTQDYYDYTKGIIFVIDPFSIQAYYHEHQENIDLIVDVVRPSQASVMAVYEHMKEKIEKVRRGNYSIPLAIVVNKVDVLDLEDEIGVPGAQALMALDPSISTEEDAMSKLVRKFLCKYGLDNFVRDLEAYFSTVKYFSCSALGRPPIPSDSSGFIPRRVLEPLVWLLTRA